MESLTIIPLYIRSKNFADVSNFRIVFLEYNLKNLIIMGDLNVRIEEEVHSSTNVVSPRTSFDKEVFLQDIQQQLLHTVLH